MHCGLLFDKPTKEYTRKMKSDNPRFYCGLSCASHANNQLPGRVEINRGTAIRNLAWRNSDPDHLALALRGSQSWKYVELENLFTARGLIFQFEFPLTTSQGEIRIYDLAFPLDGVLVEFDGPNHQFDKKYANTVDAQKNELADLQSWRLMRINVAPNAVIPRSVAIEIVSQL
jgi:very-short-patch-repair endonuclease